MLLPRTIAALSAPRVFIGCVLLTAAALSVAGCPSTGLPAPDAPKDVQVRFRTFDIGSDDCEDIFSFGDFTVQVRVVVLPAGDEVFSVTRFAELGSAAFQSTVQSIDLNETAAFLLNPGEEFEVQVTIVEDDPIDSLEPQPWSVTRSFDYLIVDSESISIVNGPDCFRDDRLDFEINTVTP